MWHITPSRLVGGRREMQEFVARTHSRPEYRSVEIIGVIPLAKDLVGDAHERYCVETFLRCVREIATQDDLPIRR
jgi:hypothetical protein